ncbi:hypothetical protein CHS0354_027480 [Potamilus streckersoni]|uniref:Uncharacterized protein n=1 Tax=Potamilus streckersoni TaxID=2493646 RepID=A0AAE0S4J6_9BIVA|nr:hypothetical protein CHS0354_027480 [Potamilus streckersoni]
MGFLLKVWYQGCENDRKCPRCKLIGHAAKDCEIFVPGATYAGATYPERVAQNNDNVNLNEKDLVEIQNAVEIGTGQQRVQLEITQIREEEGQTIPQNTTPKKSLDELFQTCEKLPSKLILHKKKKEGEIREGEDSEIETDKDTGLDLDSNQNHENRTDDNEETKRK